ncbi:Putative MucR family transcriptional regulatory protein y4pD [Hyphomicrobiales bacterium]|nr:putative MucR family transcriptional regulatory protein y4pD [Hyphomicrobiales bacterium]CAH1673056.1 Putative MucR family transcriptional regulatory protein y4pD [Hyphomicrobiales bacterium]
MTTPTEQTDTSDLVTLSADVVSAYVSNNLVPAEELPKLIGEIYSALIALNAPVAAASEPKPEPAVPVRKSITPDFIICLEDGKKFKSLKRHLQAHYGLTPAEYRQKWGLPADYPMVAPNYAATRSALARASGLGQIRGGRRAESEVETVEPVVEAAPKRAARKAKAEPAAAPAPAKRSRKTKSAS